MKTIEKRVIFNNIFRTGTHGATGECYCGIHHLDCANHWDDDHAETVLPSAEKAAQEHPERYQFQDNAIEFFDFNQRLYVFGCRCAMDDFVFEFLIEEKQRVLNFYRKTQDLLNASDIT